MDIAFIMGMVLGFLLGIGFCLFFTNIVTRRVVLVLTTSYGKKIKKKLEDNDEPADWWKDEDYDPRKHKD